MPFQTEEPEARDAKFFDKIALFSAVVSLLCVLGAHLIDRMSQDGSLMALVGSRGDAGNRLFRHGVDRKTRAM